MTGWSKTAPHSHRQNYQSLKNFSFGFDEIARARQLKLSERLCPLDIADFQVEEQIAGTGHVSLKLARTFSNTRIPLANMIL